MKGYYLVSNSKKDASEKGEGGYFSTFKKILTKENCVKGGRNEY